jgi:hypothetical protein
VGLSEILELTDDVTIRSKRLSRETESLCEIDKIWVLDNKVPVTVIHPEIPIRDSDLRSPVINVVFLDVPVNLDRAHVICTVEQRRLYHATVGPSCAFQSRKLFITCLPEVHTTSSNEYSVGQTIINRPTQRTL